MIKGKSSKNGEIQDGNSAACETLTVNLKLFTLKIFADSQEHQAQNEADGNASQLPNQMVIEGPFKKENDCQHDS